jgi:hypothetical protein
MFVGFFLTFSDGSRKRNGDSGAPESVTINETSSKLGRAVHRGIRLAGTGRGDLPLRSSEELFIESRLLLELSVEGEARFRAGRKGGGGGFRGTFFRSEIRFHSHQQFRSWHLEILDSATSILVNRSITVTMAAENISPELLWELTRKIAILLNLETCAYAKHHRLQQLILGQAEIWRRCLFLARPSQP